MNTSKINVVEIFDEMLLIDYAQQGDKWMDALNRSIQRKIPDSHGYSLVHKQASADFRYPHLELTINIQSGTTSMAANIPSLKIVPFTQNNDDAKLLYVVLSSTYQISDDDKALWIDSIKESLAKLDEDNPEFEWAAVLGQANDPSTQKYSLRERFTTEELTIRSGKRQFIDNHMPSTPRYFSSSSFTISWPVIVEGKSKGFDWMVASKQASLDTHKIAAILSLAWNSTWYLLQSPVIAAHGTLKLPTKNPLGRRQHHFPHPRKARAIPAWTQKASEAFDDNVDIKAAVTAYYQGLQLSEKHPSFALVAIVSSIEIIGKMIVGERCECCGSRTTSNQRFKAGVDAVVSDKRKAKEVYGMYASRSSTAHSGELHGNEEMLGYVSFSVFARDNKSFFVYTDLERVRVISRKLLVNALKGKYE